MNPPIVRLYVFVLLLFGSLVYFTSKWAIFDAEELEGKNTNRRPLIEQQQIPRGSITTRDGVLVAESVPVGGGRKPVYVRRYPQGALFGHPVGHSFVEVGSSEIEESENDLLIGEENEFQTIIDELRDQQPEGADITLTLDAEAQRLATQLLESAVTDPEEPGASLVAIEPSTGAVRVMASVPGYDPNEVQDEDALDRLNADEVRAPLVDRATQSRYPPGSTMKVVTAAAALDSGEFEPESVLDASSPIDVSGVPLENSGGQDFGEIDMTTALTNSVNTYWAQVGEQLGTDTMVEYMERFGFYEDPKLGFPDDEVIASGVVSENELVKDDFDVGRVAIGQGGAEGQLLATPMQMAQVAATIANDGTLMEPTFLQEAQDPDGRTIEELDPEEQSEVISEEAANQLADMMQNVTEEGTASSLSVAGVSFAGKTGTAEIDLEGTNQPWFITFAPADDPQIAVAATVERCQGCFGGDTAGPIATAVMENLLAN
ncbi:MAG TPA: penicillin-binding protein 2 [Solirubrobacterales bacterium]|nr:penicillin-binding protein 2 [Solirubrobacterales bacterium]